VSSPTPEERADAVHRKWKRGFALYTDLVAEEIRAAVEAEREAIALALGELSAKGDDECERYDEAHGRSHPEGVIRLSGEATGLHQAADFVRGLNKSKESAC
jgi:hypothetical protein